MNVEASFESNSVPVLTRLVELLSLCNGFALPEAPEDFFEVEATFESSLKRLVPVI